MEKAAKMEKIMCAMPTPSPEAQAALENVRKIAIVGVSPKVERPSYKIAEYLIEKGYEIIPIRPGITELLGKRVYSSLEDYGQAVDIVNIFRKPEAVPEIVDQAIQIGCKCVWMQEGICHEKAAEKAKNAGIEVVQNKCILRVHQIMQK